MTPTETTQALAVLTDLATELASTCPLDIAVGALLLGYERANPSAFDDVPPEGRSEGASVRIVHAFAKRGMLLPQAPERKSACDQEEILRAIPDRWVSAITIARRMGFKSAQAVVLAPTVPRQDIPHDEHHWADRRFPYVEPAFVRALYALSQQHLLLRESVDHARQNNVVRYRRTR